MSQTESDAEQVVKDYAELWNEQDYERISDVVSESFVHVTPGVPDGKAWGPDGVEAFMREVTTGFPDFEVRTIEMLSSDEMVMVEHKFTMTHKGEFNGIPPTEREVEIQSMAKCHVADGKLQELREYMNMQAFFDQLGVTEEHVRNKFTRTTATGEGSRSLAAIHHGISDRRSLSTEWYSSGLSELNPMLH